MLEPLLVTPSWQPTLSQPVGISQDQCLISLLDISDISDILLILFMPLGTESSFLGFALIISPFQLSTLNLVIQQLSLQCKPKDRVLQFGYF